MCSKNETTIKTIYSKINEIIKESGVREDCCNHMLTGDDINTLRVGDFLYLTNDGSKPVAVALPDPLPKPIETHMNHGKMKVIIHNHVPILAMFMNGVVVFYGEFELILPQYNDTFSLKAFIDKEFKKMGISGKGLQLKITNNHVQPTMKTGNLSMFKKVKLINNGEFTGTRPGDTGIIFESALSLHNKGWIKGAGGNGNPGTAGRAGTDGANGGKGGNSTVLGPEIWNGALKTYSWYEPINGQGGTYRAPKVHFGNHTWSNGHTDTQIAFKWSAGGDYEYNGTHDNITYKGIKYYRGKFKLKTAGSHFSTIKYYGFHKGVKATGGAGGAGGKGGSAGTAGTAGVGQSFKTARTDGGAGGKGGTGMPGKPGKPSKPAGGNSGGSGKPGSSGSSGTSGTNGGDWGKPGGPPGRPAGKAVTGKRYWVNIAAGTGNVIGAII